MVHLVYSKYLKEGGVWVKPTWAEYFDEIVGYAASAGIDCEKNENMKTILNMFSKHCVKVLVALL